MMDEKFGFIGTGNMASALIRGLLDASITKSLNLISSDRDKEKLRAMEKERSIKTTTDNKRVVEFADIIFVCVKPDIIKPVLQEIKNIITRKKLVISIVAGIKLKTLETIDARIVRVMPNTPCFVQETAAGFAMGKNTTVKDKKTVEQIFNSIGTAFALDEELLDVVTGLSGSGPGFFALVIDALAKGAEEQGLDRKTALKLAAQTALGTGKLLLKSGMQPEELIKIVSSPQGTTVEGFKVLNNSNIVEVLKKTVAAATRRSRELGK